MPEIKEKIAKRSSMGLSGLIVRVLLLLSLCNALFGCTDESLSSSDKTSIESRVENESSSNDEESSVAKGSSVAEESFVEEENTSDEESSDDENNDKDGFILITDVIPDAILEI